MTFQSTSIANPIDAILQSPETDWSLFLPGDYGRTDDNPVLEYRGVNPELGMSLAVYAEAIDLENLDSFRDASLELKRNDGGSSSATIANLTGNTPLRIFNALNRQPQFYRDRSISAPSNMHFPPAEGTNSAISIAYTCFKHGVASLKQALLLEQVWDAVKNAPIDSTLNPTSVNNSRWQETSYEETQVKKPNYPPSALEKNTRDEEVKVDVITYKIEFNNLRIELRSTNPQIQCHPICFAEDVGSIQSLARTELIVTTPGSKEGNVYFESDEFRISRMMNVIGGRLIKGRESLKELKTI